MKTVDNIQFLRSELKQDLGFIHEQYVKNREMTKRLSLNPHADEYDFSAVGYTLHNFYNAIEAYCFRISKFFENHLEANSWHRSLLNKMTLDVEDVRPALFDAEFAHKLSELLGFRHLFRNLYKEPLIPEKVMRVNGIAENMASEFQLYHDRFDSFLLSMISSIKSLDDE